ncbi:MAG: nitrite/sulfite reductase [Polyangiaceae bacterium]
MVDEHPALDAGIANALLQLHAEAARFRSGELAPDQFRGLRVAQGIYEQRRAGRFMLRLRMAGGYVTFNQLESLALAAEAVGGPRLHITTRQDIQLHDLTLEAALRVQGELLGVGLTSYGSGGNTVRNVVVDPLSGLMSGDAFDVGPHALALASRYLGPGRHPSLPRKFKMALSASDEDRGGAAVSDLGFVARRKGDALGFGVYVAGGLGQGATVGLELTSWVDADAIFDIADTMIRLFAERGDRVHRHRARLRHVRKDLGDEAFLDLCRQEIAKAAGRSVEPSRGIDAVAPGVATKVDAPTALRDERPGVFSQQEPGKVCVRLAPSQGDLSASSLQALVRIARGRCSDRLRLGLEQDLWLTHVESSELEGLLAELAGLGLGTPVERPSPVIACSGAATCQLGLLQSRGAANAVERQSDALRRLELAGPIRISGCPNACSRHLVAPLGFEGRTKRVQGRLMPHYSVFFGGTDRGAQATLGHKLGAVPAKRLDEFVVALSQLPRPLSESDIAGCVSAFSELPETIPEDWFFDWGRSSPIDLSELGAGECAASV